MEMHMSLIEDQFTGAMFTIYRRAKSEAHYQANIFLDMLNAKGGLTTARILINSPEESTGYTELYLGKRLDLTVEATVVEEERWHNLFTQEELDRARRRLERHGYVPKARGQGKQNG
jgi:hypothetical protein